MSESKVFDATIVRAGGYRELHQGIRYEGGRAVEYRCPDCGGLHPLDPRDWDEARGVYAGRHCGEQPRIVRQRAGNAAAKRGYYATHPEYRAREIARVAARRKAARGDAPPTLPTGTAIPDPERARTIHEAARQRARDRFERERSAQGKG